MNRRNKNKMDQFGAILLKNYASGVIRKEEPKLIAHKSAELTLNVDTTMKMDGVDG